MNFQDTMNEPGRTISVLGTGDFGCAIAKRLLQNGYTVYIGSRHPSKRNLAKRAEELTDATVVSIPECIQASEMIVVAIPCTNFDTLKKYESLLGGRVLVDVSNPKKLSKGMSQAELLAQMFPNSRVVKAFNTVSAYSMGDDTSNEHRNVSVASDDVGASGMVIQLARDIGFATHNSGRLRKARELEADTLSLFSGWGGPTLFTLVLFVIEVVYLVVTMYVIGSRHHISEFPTYMMYKAFGVMSMNLLALCYLPSMLAAFAQIFYGTKHKRFQPWLDAWLQGRKQLGIYALLFGFMHMITAMTCLNTAYFGYLFHHETATIPFNTTKDTVIHLDSKMDLFGEGCIITGVLALCAMGILGLTSLPPVGALLNWREWRFIQSKFGFVCFLLALFHTMLLGVPEWLALGSLPLRNSFMGLLIPWLTLFLRLVYLIPCVHIYVWKIRRGHERGRHYDTEEGHMTSFTRTDVPVWVNGGFEPDAANGKMGGVQRDSHQNGAASNFSEITGKPMPERGQKEESLTTL